MNNYIAETGPDHGNAKGAGAPKDNCNAVHPACKSPKGLAYFRWKRDFKKRMKSALADAKIEIAERRSRRKP